MDFIRSELIRASGWHAHLRYAGLGFLYIIVLLVLGPAAMTQPTDRLWQRMIYLRDTNPGVAPELQLKEFRKYESDQNINHPLPDSTFALLLQRIGVQYLKLSDYKKAIAYSTRSVKLEESHAHHTARGIELLCNGYYNLYYCNYLLQNQSKIHEMIDSCIALGVRYQVWDYKLVHSLAEKTHFSLQSGDYETCIRMADLGRNIVHLYYKNSDSLEFISLLDADRINALLQMEHYTEAEAAARIVIGHFTAQSRQAYAGTMYILLAKALEGKRLFEPAIRYLDRSFIENRKQGFRDASGQSLAEKGFIYYSQLHQDQKALRIFKEALRYSNRADSLFIWDNIANIYAHLNLYPQALGAVKNAFALIGPNADETELLSVPLDQTSEHIIQYVSDLVLDKAAIYLKKYKTTGSNADLFHAIRLYRTADAFFDKIRLAQKETQSTLFWRKDNRRLYGNAIEASYLASNNDEAFFFFEKSRAVLLSDELNRLDLSNDSDIANQAGLKQRINEVEKQMALTSNTTADYARLQAEDIQLKQDIHTGYEKLRFSKPLYFQNMIDSNLVSVQDVQKSILTKGESLLEIFEADSFVYLFKISDTDTRLKRVNSSLYDSLVRIYLADISDPSLLNNDFDRFLKSARSLYSLIISGMALDSGRLIVSADRRNFPFESLVGSGEGKPVKYLIEDMPVSYTFSARYLFSSLQPVSDNSGGNNFLGFAPEHFPDLYHLFVLDGSAQSIKNIESGLTGANTYIHAEASRSRFLQHFSYYRIIQLYTHSSANSGSDDPVIYFADSSLRLSELISPKKPVTRLIVLSGCETGTGKLYEGEGIFSFSRGFAALGIPASIGNLWAIDSRSTYELTEMFYRQLGKGFPVDEALQKAKIEFIRNSSKERSLPYYWASTLLVGRADAIPLNLKTKFKWQWFALAALLTGTVIYLFKKKAKTSLQHRPGLFEEAVVTRETGY